MQILWPPFLGLVQWSSGPVRTRHEVMPCHAPGDLPATATSEFSGTAPSSARHSGRSTGSLKKVGQIRWRMEAGESAVESVDSLRVINII
jgi:hypothetical protein